MMKFIHLFLHLTKGIKKNIFVSNNENDRNENFEYAGTLVPQRFQAISTG